MTIQVLRLSRPRINQPPLLIDLNSSNAKESRTSQYELHESMPTNPESPTILQLPSNFGNLYVGETFRAIISVHSIAMDKSLHHGVTQMPDKLSVTLSVSITTPLKEHPIQIINNSHPGSTFIIDSTQQSKEYVVDFETKDVGLHTMSATVTYIPIIDSSEGNQDLQNSEKLAKDTEGATGLDPLTQHAIEYQKQQQQKHAFPPPPQSPLSPVDGRFPVQPVSYTKNYRFSTASGFNVGTKITQIAHDTHILEARIENATDNTVTIEAADFLAPTGWISRALSQDEEKLPDTTESIRLEDQDIEDATLTSMDSPSLMPKETWQFSYIVQHDPEFGSISRSSTPPTILNTDNNSPGTPISNDLPGINIDKLSSVTAMTTEFKKLSIPSKNNIPATRLVRQSIDTGKFYFSWRREHLGERGWLMTDRLKRTPNLEYWGT